MSNEALKMRGHVHGTKDARRVAIGSGVGAVIDIPFDPVIAGGTSITLGALNRASQIAWTQLAAATVANISLHTGKN